MKLLKVQEESFDSCNATFDSLLCDNSEWSPSRLTILHLPPRESFPPSGPHKVLENPIATQIFPCAFLCGSKLKKNDSCIHHSWHCPRLKKCCTMHGHLYWMDIGSYMAGKRILNILNSFDKAPWSSTSPFLSNCKALQMRSWARG